MKYEIRFVLRCFHIEAFDIKSGNFEYIIIRYSTSHILIHTEHFSKTSDEIFT